MRTGALPARVEAFLFAPVDPAIAGGFRAAVAAMVAVVFWPEQGYFLSDFAAGLPGMRRAFEWTAHVGPLWWLALALLALFGSGRAPRMSGAALLLLLAPRVLMDGVQESRHILLFCLAALAMLGGGEAFLRPRAVGPMWPIRLVQLQLSIMYGVNAVAKTTPEFLSGEVLMALSRLPNFLIDLGDGFVHLGPIAVPVALAAVGTAAVEYALAVGFWLPRLRWATALLGVTFHGGLAMVIAIGWLDWTCVLLYAAFLLPLELPEAPRGGEIEA